MLKTPLSQAVLDALDLHASYELPELNLKPARKRLVVASGNALPTARVVFADEPARFCNEGEYTQVLEIDSEIDSVAVVSASGKKHAPIIAQDVLDRGLDTYLLTCDKDSPAAKLLPDDHVFETKSVEEPITYNTSTYMGMILLATREDTAAVKTHILETVKPLIGEMTKYEAFYVILPPEFDVVCEMVVTKFDELFGGRVNGRCYTMEQTYHAKTVVPWEKELFVGIGVENDIFGTERLNLPLPEKCGYAGVMAVSYYFVGQLQEQFPPWFMEHAEEYARIQAELFASREK